MVNQIEDRPTHISAWIKNSLTANLHHKICIRPQY